MNQLFCRTQIPPAWWKMILIVTGAMLLDGCARTAKKTAETHREPSRITVVAQAGGPILLTTSAAEFQILPSGYVQAWLLKAGQKLSLDEPGESRLGESGYLVQETKELHFTQDFSQAKVTDAMGKLGRGKRVEIPAQSLSPSGTGLRRTVQVEVYDDFP
jgi:hypothetical protein